MEDDCSTIARLELRTVLRHGSSYSSPATTRRALTTACCPRAAAAKPAAAAIGSALAQPAAGAPTRADGAAPTVARALLARARSSSHLRAPPPARAPPWCPPSPPAEPPRADRRRAGTMRSSAVRVARDAGQEDGRDPVGIAGNGQRRASLETHRMNPEKRPARALGKLSGGNHVATPAVAAAAPSSRLFSTRRASPPRTSTRCRHGCPCSPRAWVSPACSCRTSR